MWPNEHELREEGLLLADQVVAHDVLAARVKQIVLREEKGPSPDRSLVAAQRHVQGQRDPVEDLVPVQHPPLVHYPVVVHQSVASHHWLL